MTPPDSVGKDERRCVRHECKRVRMEMQAELTRLQALDRQRQEDALRDARMLEDAHNGIGELQAALAEARELIADYREAHERAVGNPLMILSDPESMSACADNMRVLERTRRRMFRFLTRTAKEPNND